MQLDSKESDIEQLREKLNDLQLRMDNSSVTSLQPDETDSNIAGRASAGFEWGLPPTSFREAVLTVHLGFMHSSWFQSLQAENLCQCT